MLTCDAPIDLTYVDNQRRVVLNAIANGGGWVQIFWHRLCPDDCDEYSWPPAWLHEFLTWLEQQRAAGTVDVKSSQEVLGLPFHPAVAPAAAPKPPKGANRLRNAALVRAKGADAPRCWEHRGGGEWQRAGGESVPIGGAPDGFAALAVPQDQGGCAPAVKAGERLTARATYRSADRPRLLSGRARRRAADRSGATARGCPCRTASGRPC